MVSPVEAEVRPFTVTASTAPGESGTLTVRSMVVPSTWVARLGFPRVLLIV